MCRRSSDLPEASLSVTLLLLALLLVGCDFYREARSAEEYFRQVIAGGKPLKYENFKGSISCGTRWVGPVFVMAAFSAESNSVAAITRDWGLRFLKFSEREEFTPSRLDHLALMKQFLGADVEKFYGGSVFSNYYISQREQTQRRVRADMTLITARDGSEVCLFFLYRK